MEQDITIRELASYIRSISPDVDDQELAEGIDMLKSQFPDMTNAELAGIVYLSLNDNKPSFDALRQRMGR